MWKIACHLIPIEDGLLKTAEVSHEFQSAPLLEQILLRDFVFYSQRSFQNAQFRGYVSVGQQ